MTIGERVTAFLTHQGWTQDELATKMRVSRQSVNSMIAGRFRLTPLMALRLEKVSQGSLPADKLLWQQVQLDLATARRLLDPAKRKARL